MIPPGFEPGTPAFLTQRKCFPLTVNLPLQEITILF